MLASHQKIEIDLFKNIGWFQNFGGNKNVKRYEIHGRMVVGWIRFQKIEIDLKFTKISLKNVGWFQNFGG